MQLSYDQYRVIKNVVEFNTSRINRPRLDQDYITQINNAFDLMRMILPRDKPIFMMAPKGEHVRNFQNRLNGKSKGRRVHYITNALDLRGIQDAVLIILSIHDSGRYSAERQHVLDYLRSLHYEYHIDVWNIGET